MKFDILISTCWSTRENTKRKGEISKERPKDRRRGRKKAKNGKIFCKINRVDLLLNLIF